MRAVVVTRTGGPDVLRVQDRPEPEAGPGQVRIAVRAAGLNFADVMARVGLYLSRAEAAQRARLRSGRGDRIGRRRRVRLEGRAAGHGRDDVRWPGRTGGSRGQGRPGPSRPAELRGGCRVLRELRHGVRGHDHHGRPATGRSGAHPRRGRRGRNRGHADRAERRRRRSSARRPRPSTTPSPPRACGTRSTTGPWISRPPSAA